jgi:calnexin
MKSRSSFSILALICLFAVISLISGEGEKNALFVETFNDDVFANGKWILSKNSKYAGQPVKVMGTNEEIPGLDTKNDRGIQLTQEMKHYGFSTPFSSPISIGSKHKDLYIQYEIKFLDVFNCGGAYIKLLREKATSSLLENLDSATPYAIMFGPDKCGTTNKIHFIIQYQNRVDGKWEEKHFNETIPIRADKNTHLYTLALHSDNSFEIFVDTKTARKGNLLTHMTPAINPPETIPDVEDKKPSDWVDDKMMIDETATKPEDWDENQPKKIIDTKSTKPSGWLDDEPETIPNPDVTKPEDWDDQEVSLSFSLFSFGVIDWLIVSFLLSFVY